MKIGVYFDPCQKCNLDPETNFDRRNCSNAPYSSFCPKQKYNIQRREAIEKEFFSIFKEKQ